MYSPKAMIKSVSLFTSDSGTRDKRSQRKEERSGVQFAILINLGSST
jgi:hypothetical protein